jgi:hypothetical protein
MLESPAYRALSLSGRRILDRLEIELAHNGGDGNGRLATTYEHFEEYGLDRDCIAPAIRECVALGFLEVTEQGRAGNREYRRPNRFRLTYRPKARANPSDDWRKIETIEQAQQVARDGRKKEIFSRGLSEVSVGKTPTENVKLLVRKTPTIGHSRKTPTTSISREGDGDAQDAPLPSQPKISLSPIPLKNSGRSAISLVGLAERQLKAGRPLGDALRASVVACVSDAPPGSDLHHRASRVLGELVA